MTTLTLRPPTPVSERILAFGGPGTGKSTNIITVARRIPDANFYVIDSDGAFGRMLSGQNSDLWSENGGNIHVETVFEWGEYENALDGFMQSARPNDWIVSDMIDPAWEAVQDFFSEQVFGKGVEQFFLEARAAAKKGSAFDGRKDWTVINKLYRNWVNRMMLKARCHVYATAGVAMVQEDDAKEIQAMYGRFGVKPTGQKHNGHKVHTVLWNTRSKAGGWQVTTVKDRERVELDHETIENFANDYLCKVAGWKVGKVEA